MNDWVPVLIVALVVVCVTAFLLLDPKSRTPRKARAGPFTSRLVIGLLLRDVALKGMFQGRSAADPKKAHPRISTTSGMPNAMVAHISSLAHGTSA